MGVGAVEGGAWAKAEAVSMVIIIIANNGIRRMIEASLAL
jgi:hypothetical protein